MKFQGFQLFHQLESLRETLVLDFDDPMGFVGKYPPRALLTTTTRFVSTCVTFVGGPVITRVVHVAVEYSSWPIAWRHVEDRMFTRDTTHKAKVISAVQIVIEKVI